MSLIFDFRTVSTGSERGRSESGDWSTEGRKDEKGKRGRCGPRAGRDREPFEIESLMRRRSLEILKEKVEEIP